MKVEGVSTMEDAEKFKEAGNEAYKNGDIDEAIDLYTKAINTAPQDHKSLAVYYKNRAQAYLKQEDFERASRDCDKSLEIVENDPKALFRRCQAHEALGNVDAAYKDAREVHRLDPSNKAIQPYLERLHRAIAEKLSHLSQTSTKVKNMFEIAFDLGTDMERREKATDNLIVLAKEKHGAELLFKEGVVPKIVRMMKVEKNPAIRLSAVRCLSQLCAGSIERSKAVLQEAGVPFFLNVLDSNKEETIHAASYCIQTILDALSAIEIQKKVKEMKKNPRLMSSADRKWCNSEEARRQELIKENGKEITAIMHVITFNVTSRTINAEARDALIELIMKNAKYEELNWGERLLTTDAYQRLMEVASELKEYKHESSMDITHNTRSIVGVCLAVMYDAMWDDRRRNAIVAEVEKFIAEKLRDMSVEGQCRAIVSITTLLQHASELGSGQIAKDGILQMMLQMAQSGDFIQQMVASEALIAATMKKKDTNVIVSQGLDILKQLYHSKNDQIKVRALVGLCKLGASAGHDASLRPFADGSTSKLAEACRRYLINPGKDRDLRRWAIEGLSYLTLDAEVKEKLTEDEGAIKAMIELAKTGKQDLAYGVVTLLVNLTNSYEKQEIMPELLELAKFAKHHIPQEHELDDQDFIDKRTWTLGKLGITSALVALSKTESKNVKEMISRVLNAICKFPDLRGMVVQQGGSKVLCQLALDGNERGMRQAAQALARIGITQDPAIAFPGQRSCEIIRPICQLLNSEYEALENFEALMALGNLASLSESTRTRILKESDFVCAIETYMFDEHTMLRRAAIQCWTNLCSSQIQVKRCEGKNDKVKYCVLLCGDDEDEEVVKAASGALAMLTSQSNKVCKKVFESIQWKDCLLNLLANPNLEVVLRGSVIIKNLVSSGKEVATQILETEIMEVLQAHIFKANLDQGSYEPDQNLQKIKSIAEETLNVAHEMRLIKTKAEAEKEPDSD